MARSDRRVRGDAGGAGAPGRTQRTRLAAAADQRPGSEPRDVASVRRRARWHPRADRVRSSRRRRIGAAALADADGAAGAAGGGGARPLRIHPARRARLLARGRRRAGVRPPRARQGRSAGVVRHLPGAAEHSPEPDRGNADAHAGALLEPAARRDDPADHRRGTDRARPRRAPRGHRGAPVPAADGARIPVPAVRRDRMEQPRLAWSPAAPDTRGARRPRSRRAAGQRPVPGRRAAARPPGGRQGRGPPVPARRARERDAGDPELPGVPSGA